MLPFLGQGACSALEDAVALGAAVGASRDPPTALAAYERARIKPAASPRRAAPAAPRKAALAGLGAGRGRSATRSSAARPNRLRLRQLDPLIGRAG